jgi:hypothetical protein
MVSINEVSLMLSFFVLFLILAISISTFSRQIGPFDAAAPCNTVVRFMNRNARVPKKVCFFKCCVIGYNGQNSSGQSRETPL